MQRNVFRVAIVYLAVCWLRMPSGLEGDNAAYQYAEIYAQWGDMTPALD